MLLFATCFAPSITREHINPNRSWQLAAVAPLEITLVAAEQSS